LDQFRENGPRRPGDVPAHGADDPHRDRSGVPQRVPDRDHRLAHFPLARIAVLDRGILARGQDADDGQVLVRIHPRHFALVDLVIRINEADRHDLVFANDMAIGNRVAARVDDDAGPS
jgi:hypothetical protein